MVTWVAVGFFLRRNMESGRLSREMSDDGKRFHHVVNVDGASTIDEEFSDWITEAYHHGRASISSPHDPMIPDDIDFELG